MGSHLIDNQFQSDKYTWCKPGFVPLKLTDRMAQDLLYEYAQRRRAVDPEFSADLETALKNAGAEQVAAFWKPKTYGRELSGGICLMVDAHIGAAKWNWKVFRVDAMGRETLAHGDAGSLEAGMAAANTVAKVMGFDV